MWVEKYIDSDGQILSIDREWTNWIFYYNSSKQYHRLDGPAYIYKNLYRHYKNGILHRIGGPAEYWGTEKWWIVNGNVVEIYYIYG